jgi:DNA-binding response OmpR family regulator
MFSGECMDVSKILIVDDEPDTLGLIELTLQTAGYQVTTAVNGDQALGLIIDDSFDLILLDIMMPGMTGFDLINNLRDREIAVPPIIFLTAKSHEEDREMGEKLGAAAYLKKPTTRGDLLDSIQTALGPPPIPDAEH